MTYDQNDFKKYQNIKNTENGDYTQSFMFFVFTRNGLFAYNRLHTINKSSSQFITFIKCLHITNDHKSISQTKITPCVISELKDLFNI